MRLYQLIIVEDESDIRNGLLRFIPWEEIGFEVVGDFSCGKSAIAFLENNYIDVVLTDIKMTDGSGLDIAKFLKTNRRLEKIVLYSAYKDFSYARLGIEYGVTQYITKDMGYHEIIETMKQIRGDFEKSSYPQDLETGEVIASSRIKILHSYLAKNFQTATLQSAAQVVRLNPTYFSTFVKKETNKNFSTILTEYKMNKAIELLNTSNYKIFEIAKIVGYSDVRYFIRSFKQYYGVSPGKYRKKQKKRGP